MVALRKQTSNIEIVTEEFRRSALRALAALQQVDAGPTLNHQEARQDDARPRGA
jgi:hypothetical protein